MKAIASALKARADNLAAFAWGVAEASVFFIVPDVLLSYIGVKRGPRAAGVASLWAACGAALGGVGMYLWAQSDPDAARAFVLAVPAISLAMAEAAARAMAEQGWFPATLSGPLSRTPYKVYAILAPAADAPLWAFAAASVIARLPRFLLVGAGAALIARFLQPRLGAKAILAIFVTAWLLFYAAFFALTPG
ncbi:MAG TPA: hypothetical protein PKY87_05150 [Terricaulis sp.]|nr:hypothetical protein [Terricaulis sp.]